jgi:hypothetical protein
VSNGKLPDCVRWGRIQPTTAPAGINTPREEIVPRQKNCMCLQNAAPVWQSGFSLDEKRVRLFTSIGHPAWGTEIAGTGSALIASYFRTELWTIAR